MSKSILDDMVFVGVGKRPSISRENYYVVNHGYVSKEMWKDLYEFQHWPSFSKRFRETNDRFWEFNLLINEVEDGFSDYRRGYVKAGEIKFYRWSLFSKYVHLPLLQAYLYFKRLAGPLKT